LHLNLHLPPVLVLVLGLIRQMEIADGDDDVGSDQQHPFKPIRLAILNQLTGREFPG